MTFFEKYGVFLALVLVVVLIIGVGLMGIWPLEIRWIIIMLVMSGFLAFIGKVRTIREYVDVNGEKKKTAGRFDGIFIDSRNKISLSYFQITLWTVLALSAWSAIALHRTIPIILDNFQELRVLVTEELEKGDDVEVDSILPSIFKDFLKEKELEDKVVESLYTLITGEGELPESINEIQVYDPLNVGFPQELLLAMGISTVSLAGAAFIKTSKAKTESGRSIEITQKEVKKAFDVLQDAKAIRDRIQGQIKEINGKIATTSDEELKKDFKSQLALLAVKEEEAAKSVADAQRKYDELSQADKDRAGLLHVNEDIDQAKWSDIFSGEKVHNYQLPDIAKVQMFFITLIIVFTYAALIWALMSTKFAESLYWILPTMSLPAFSESMVVLLGLSHAGYLSVKTTD
jgi:hypothetical protein